MQRFHKIAEPTLAHVSVSDTSIRVQVTLPGIKFVENRLSANENLVVIRIDTTCLWINLYVAQGSEGKLHSCFHQLTKAQKIQFYASTFSFFFFSSPIT